MEHHNRRKSDPLPEALTDKGMEVTAVVLAWRQFKRTHDLESIQITCCQHTAALYFCLTALERACGMTDG